jgi:hypothetical protein
VFVEKRRLFVWGRLDQSERRLKEVLKATRNCMYCDNAGFIGFTKCMLREMPMSRALLRDLARNAGNFISSED